MMEEDDFALIRPDAVVYLAGPMSGKPMMNYPAFFGYAGLIAKEFGCKVLNPARQPNGLTYEKYMELALEDVDKATVIVLLEGWDESNGAKQEFIHAHKAGKDIILQGQIDHILKTRIITNQPKARNEAL